MSCKYSVDTQVLCVDTILLKSDLRSKGASCAEISLQTVLEGRSDNAVGFPTSISQFESAKCSGWMQSCCQDFSNGELQDPEHIQIVTVHWQATVNIMGHEEFENATIF